MSLIVTGAMIVAVAAAAGAGALVLRRRPAHAAAARPVEGQPGLGARFPVEVGEVVDLAGEEVWLSEGWLLSEGAEPVAALLFAEPAVVLVTPEPHPVVYRLAAVTATLAGDPPPTLELDRSSFRRIRRLPVRLSSLSPSRPVPFEAGLLFEYAGVGERLWVLRGASAVIAWRGREIVPGTVQRWGVAEKG